MTVNLYKSFFQGMTDYIAKHNANYSAIESNLNYILGVLTGQSGGDLAVPPGLKEIFDRAGLIGIGSYDFDEETLTGPDYNLSVDPGAYWSGAAFLSKAIASTLSLAGRATGTWYVYLDSAGVPALSDILKDNTLRQFHWNASTHAVSDKQLYTGVAVLFDGDDYQDMLDSAARSKSFTRVADRLEEIEQLLGEMAGYYAYDHDDGLDFYYKAGKVRNDSTITETPAGHITLTGDQTNYVEVAPATGAVSANTTGFTSGQIPLYQTVTDADSITSVTDQRTWTAAGTGGGGGGHTQGTDLGTTAATFTIDTDATGSPTGRAGIEVENGDDPNAHLKFNRDTGKWQYSEDGGATWQNFGEVDLDLGNQELTRYVPKENPDLVLEELGRGSSPDFEDLDLSAYLDAPQGAQAAALRVQFWDAAPDLAVNVLFKKKGSPASPALAFTVWSGMEAPATLLVPLDDDLVCQYFVNASGADTANLRVFLLGYLRKVIGVGTQDKTFTQGDLNLGAGATEDFNLTGFLNRGLCHYLKVAETGGLATDTYDIHLYAKDTFLAADLLYQAEGIDPATDFEDWLPFWVSDHDATRELHLRIINNDATQPATFAVTLACEMFD